jgi:hypothetical protein
MVMMTGAAEQWPVTIYGGEYTQHGPCRLLSHSGCCTLSTRATSTLYTDLQSDIKKDAVLILTAGPSSAVGIDVKSQQGSWQSSAIICVSIESSSEVEDGDMVVAEWVLGMLGIPHGNVAMAELTVPRVVDDSEVATVRFVYRGYQSHRHWDAVATSTPFYHPRGWSSEWPGVSSSVVQKMLPLLLHSRRLLVDRSLIVVDVLDTSMVSVWVVMSRCCLIVDAVSTIPPISYRPEKALAVVGFFGTTLRLLLGSGWGWGVCTTEPH